MTFTYVGPSNSTADEVRFRLGDTVTPGMLSDEEIAYLVTTYGTGISASIAACDILAAKFAQLVDRRFDDIDIKASQKAANFRALAAQLRRTQALGGTPYAGGLSRADKELREQDTDRPAPAFRRDMQANPSIDSSRWGLING